MSILKSMYIHPVKRLPRKYRFDRILPDEQDLHDFSVFNLKLVLLRLSARASCLIQSARDRLQ